MTRTTPQSADPQRDFLDKAGSADFCDIAALLRDNPGLAGARSDHDDTTALHHAVFEDHADVAELLLDHGVAIDAVDDENASALMWAANMGSINSVKLLLAKGAETGTRDVQGRTAYDFAKKRGREDIARVIEENMLGETPAPRTRPPAPKKALDIIVAAAHGKGGELRQILKDYPDSPLWHEPVTGATALRNIVVYAALGPDDAQLVLDRGANVDARDLGGMTALMYAAEGGDQAVFVDVLLNAKADPTLRNDEGLTAADIAKAAQSPDYDKIQKYTLAFEMRKDFFATAAPVTVGKPLTFRPARMGGPR